LPYRTENASIRIREEVGATPAVVLQLAGAPPGGFLLARGASLELPITLDVDPQQPLGSLTGRLRYDPAVVRPTRCIRSQAESADSPMGYCNAQHDRVEGIVRFNQLSPSGIIGSLTPFTLTVEAASGASDGQMSQLNFSIETATGPLGEARTWQTENSYVRLESPVPAPRVLIGPSEPQSNGQYRLSLRHTAAVPVWVEGVTNLGAATLAIGYDPAVARVVKCIINSDLIPEIDGGFCIAPPGMGTIRANVVAQQGFSGTAQFYTIIFAQAPNMVGGESTPITVTVDNFVSVAEIPIPTTVRNGLLTATTCSPPSPVLAIALPAPDGELTWSHSTLDLCGQSVQVAAYEVWRDAAPYEVIANAPIAQIAVPPGTPAGTTFSFTETPTTTEAGLALYRIVAVAFDGPRSDFSNPKAAFNYRLIPGSPAVH